MPFIEKPYISEISFLKGIRSRNDKLKKTHFKYGKTFSPFYIYLQLRDVENRHILYLRLYNEKRKKSRELSFEFGEVGKFYEYIIFTDKVTGIKPGKYRYTIFIDKTVIYEDEITISPTI